ncbi:hypothetical protein CBR_g3042 [Chara braunii]|uniref:Nucleotide-diphospho-sugar transferase domain-containing protein n=1 Tax=Chara braunii TaxID=69332 RepID=A0A388KEL9_CHABU|nr:hypothetical protein CBR_g3042 [Chara braunii]|eukprot:GBG68498.1 hypothetical protein CBR_g3042 [Chara braunii]
MIQLVELWFGLTASFGLGVSPSYPLFTFSSLLSSSPLASSSSSSSPSSSSSSSSSSSAAALEAAASSSSFSSSPLRALQTTVDGHKCKPFYAGLVHPDLQMQDRYAESLGSAFTGLMYLKEDPGTGYYIHRWVHRDRQKKQQESRGGISQLGKMNHTYVMQSAAAAEGAKADEPLPLVVMLTINRPFCAVRTGTDVFQRTLRNRVTYIAHHPNMDMLYTMGQTEAHMFFAKWDLVSQSMKRYREYEWFMWMDADAFIMQLHFPLPWPRYQADKDVDLVLWGNDRMVYQNASFRGINSGIFMLRESDWSRKLMSALMAAQRRWRDWDMQMREEMDDAISDIIVFTDQEALLHLLRTNEKQWRRKVQFENSFYFNAYWENVVPRWQKWANTTGANRSSSDEGPSFTVHFAGCQFCRGWERYKLSACMEAFQSVDRILAHMQSSEATAANR